MAADEHQIIGFATAHAVRAVHCDPPAALLTALIVAASARRQGVGRALVAHLEAWARSQGSERIAVTTGQQRHDAQAFYARLGYVATGIRLVKELGHAR